MRLTEADGGVFCFCLCNAFAFLIASRTRTDDPALVTLTDLGVVLGVEVDEAFDRDGVRGVDV